MKVKETKLELQESIKEISQELHPNGETSKKGLITLKGITTSQINQALKADNPYPARVFLKVDNQGKDIPIFFRIKDSDNWIRPKIKKGSYLQVEGYFAINKEYFSNCKMRKSFTAYSYQLLNQEANQEILVSHDWK